MDTKHLVDLLDGYTDGALSAAEMEELERGLVGSAEARTMFWENARLHGMIREVCGEELGHRLAGTSEPSPSAPPAAPVVPPAVEESHGLLPPNTNWPIPPGHISTWLLLLAVVVSAGLGWWVRGDKSAIDDSRRVAKLVRVSHDCQWPDGIRTIDLGLHLKIDQHISLLSGLVEIRHDSGARVILQGPATYHVVSENAGVLDAGTLTARVPHEATGFTVRTPTSQVVDEGTEFGVEVDASGESEVCVFDGLVWAAPSNLQAKSQHASGASGSTRTRSSPPTVANQLTARRSLRFDRGHAPREMVFSPDRFVRHMPRSSLFLHEMAVERRDFRLIDATNDDRGDEASKAHQHDLAIGEYNGAAIDLNEGRYWLPFVPSNADRRMIRDAQRVVLRLHLEKRKNADGLRVDLYGIPGRSSPRPRPSHYQTAGELLVEGVFGEDTPDGTQRSVDVTRFVRSEAAHRGSVLVFRLQVAPSILPKYDGKRNNFILNTSLASPNYRPTLTCFLSRGDGDDQGVRY